jgi:hypothetical protein
VTNGLIKVVALQKEVHYRRFRDSLHAPNASFRRHCG